MIAGSLLATGGAILIGVPISIFTAAYLSELAKPRVKKVVKNGVLLLAGIPSVIYGVIWAGIFGAMDTRDVTAATGAVITGNYYSADYDDTANDDINI